MAELKVEQTVDHLFRHEAGKMVSVLTRIFGPNHLDLAEDVVQDTLLKALEVWRFSGIPENPSAWLYTVAKNKTLDIIRRHKRTKKFEADIIPLLESEYSAAYMLNELFLESEIKDDQLRMMFTCCHPQLSQEAQVSLILKTLCGFGIAEIARAFVTNDETISKRLYRAKEIFRDGRVAFEVPSKEDLVERLDAVLTTIYLLFNEGYSSTQHAQHIRIDLVEESLRLCLLLTGNERTNLPKVNALIALILFNASRMQSRIDDAGHILLLKEQDRSLWDKESINMGINYLSQSAAGDDISNYHLEACIAYEHCIAKSYAETNWEAILLYYNSLVAINPSSIVLLNRAIVMAELHGTDMALDELRRIASLSNYYLYQATLGELHLRKQDYKEASDAFTQAIKLTHSNSEKELLMKKLELCSV